MGVKALPNFTRRLIDGGLDPTLPAAVIQEGTTERQRVVTGTLADITQLALDAELSSPATTVIGNVVNLHETLTWYENTRQQQKD
jgi:uroporphyrin-III C-methyltransferase